MDLGDQQPAKEKKSSKKTPASKKTPETKSANEGGSLQSHLALSTALNERIWKEPSAQKRSEEPSAKKRSESSTSSVMGDVVTQT
jgi:hypothetical protein